MAGAFERCHQGSNHEVAPREPDGPASTRLPGRNVFTAPMTSELLATPALPTGTAGAGAAVAGGAAAEGAASSCSRVTFTTSTPRRTSARLISRALLPTFTSEGTFSMPVVPSRRVTCTRRTVVVAASLQTRVGGGGGGRMCWVWR